MINYTQSAIENTFDLVKRIIFIMQIVIQTVYIGFVTFRVINHMGNFYANIVLLAISAVYLFFYIITAKEFYTKKQVKFKRVFKWVVKTAKYLINICVIMLAVIPLVSGTMPYENAMMLTTMIMIVSLLLSIIFDLVILMIDRQKELIKAAVLYDMERFAIKYEGAVVALNLVKIDLAKLFPKCEDAKLIGRVKKINHLQKNKQMRKRDFKRANNE